jgi:hypothetical protein
MAIAAPAAEPVPDGLPPAWLVIIVAAPSGQEKPDQDRNDNGDEADHEQKHRTTQQAMAVWARQRGQRGHHAGLPLYR